MSKPLTEQQIAEQGRRLEAAQWHLPKKFRLQAELLSLPPEELKNRDPEMFALWTKTKEEQARLAALNVQPFGSPSAEDVERARSVTIAEHLRVSLNEINKAISAGLISGADVDINQLQADRVAIRHQLAERYAVIGRYDLSVEIEPDPVYRDEYLAILEAVWRDDDEPLCDCPPMHGSGEYADLKVPGFFEKQQIFSLKHGRVASLIKCSRCPAMNVIDTPAEIQRMHAMRTAARQAVGKVASVEEAGRLLKERGHTTAKLLK